MAKRLYILGSPVGSVMQLFRLQGFNAHAAGISYFPGVDLADVTHYSVDEDVRWAAHGTVDIEMLDRMTAHFGPRIGVKEAMEWFGARL